MNAFMISCQKATLLVEKKIVDRLSIAERMQLHFHVMMCDACTQYRRQSILIEKLLRRQTGYSVKNQIDENAAQKTAEKILKNLP